MKLFKRSSEEDALRAQVAALQQLLAQKREELAKAWKFANLSPRDRVVCLLADAARADEDVMAQILNALMREMYSANAAALLAQLVDEMERCLKEGVDAGE